MGKIEAQASICRTLSPLELFKEAYGERLFERMKQETNRQYTGMIVKESNKQVWVNIPIFEQWLIDKNTYRPKGRRAN